jgi:hypothetical protein
MEGEVERISQQPPTNLQPTQSMLIGEICDECFVRVLSNLWVNFLKKFCERVFFL